MRLLIGAAFSLSLLAVWAGSAQAMLSQYPKTYDQVVQPMTNTGGNVLAIAVDPVDKNTVYAAGNFNTFGGVARSNAAAFRLDTGAVTSWDPNVSSMLGSAALAVSEDGSTVFIGGGFVTVGGVSRPSIAAVNATTGALVSAFNAGIPAPPNPGSGSAQALVVSGSTLYIGGKFTSVGGQTRNRLAAVSTSTGAVQPWDPNVSSGIQVDSMKKVGSNFVVSGNINTIAGVSRTHIAEVDDSGNAVVSFNANANGVSISDVEASGTNVFAAGSFTSFGGQPLNRLGKVDATGTAFSSWAPDPTSQPGALALYGSSGLAVGGSFSTIGGAVRDKLAMLDSTTGLATAWNPNPSGNADALATVGTTVIAGGSFATMGFTDRRYLRNGVAVFEDIVPPDVGDRQPEIAGTAAVNGILGCTPPSVTNNDPLGYTTSYTWLRGSDPNGATDNAYTVTAADAGKVLQCRTTFTNSAGSTSTTSAAVTIPEGSTGGNSGTATVPRVRTRILSNLGQLLRDRKLKLKVGCNTSLSTRITVLTTGIRRIRLASARVSCDRAGSQEVVAKVRKAARNALKRAIGRADLQKVEVRIVARVTGAEPSRARGVLRLAG